MLIPLERKGIKGETGGQQKPTFPGARCARSRCLDFLQKPVVTKQNAQAAGGSLRVCGTLYMAEIFLNLGHDKTFQDIQLVAHTSLETGIS